MLFSSLIWCVFTGVSVLRNLGVHSHMLWELQDMWSWANELESEAMGLLEVQGSGLGEGWPLTLLKELSFQLPKPYSWTLVSAKMEQWGGVVTNVAAGALVEWRLSRPLLWTFQSFQLETGLVYPWISATWFASHLKVICICGAEKMSLHTGISGMWVSKIVFIKLSLEREIQRQWERGERDIRGRKNMMGFFRVEKIGEEVIYNSSKLFWPELLISKC